MEKTRMMYIGTHVTNLQDSMHVVLEAARRLDIEVYWAADFSKYGGDITDVPCHVLQTDFTRHPIYSVNNLRAINQLRNYIREKRIDFIHCNTPIGSFCGRIAAALEHVKPVLYTAHGLPFYIGAPVSRIPFKMIEHILAHFTDFAVAMNREDYDALQKMHLRKNKVFMINGVGVPLKHGNSEMRRIKRNELEIDSETPVIICVGRLEKIKGIDTSIRAFAKIKYQKAIMLICGQGVEKENLIKLAAELGVEKRIKFLGFRNDIFELLSASDCYVLTSQYEGLPRSVMEAMNAGVACVVSKARGNIDLIHDQQNGLTVNAGDELETARAIDRILSNPNERNAFIRQAHYDVQAYGTDAVLEQFVTIYREVLATRP